MKQAVAHAQERTRQLLVWEIKIVSVSRQGGERVSWKTDTTTTEDKSEGKQNNTKEMPQSRDSDGNLG